MSYSNAIYPNQPPSKPLSIQTDEKIQVSRETNRIHMPREVMKWIQSLDLSYKIKNINRDLKNGFAVAEMLSRYPVPHLVQSEYKVDSYYRVNMQQFSNGSSFSERTTNWRYLTDILTKFYKIPFTFDYAERILNGAPNAASDFLLILYKTLTKRSVKVLNKVDETDKFKQYAEVNVLPKYMRPTANLLVRDKEIQRIKDDLVRKTALENKLENHKSYLSKEREDFIQLKNFLKEKERLQKLRDKNKTRGGNVNNFDNSKANADGVNAEGKQDNNNNELNEVKETENSVSDSQQLKEEKVNIMGILNDLPSVMKENENVDSEFKMIIKKNFVDSDKNIELDLKNYTEEKDLLDFFFEKIDLCTEEHLTKIFSAYEDKEKDLTGIISRTLIELIPFLKIICRFFDAFYRNNIPWIQFKVPTLKICNAVRELNGEKCDNVFMNFGIDIVLDMIQVNPIYRNEMFQIIFSLASNTAESHYSILKKISKKFANCDEVLFYHILVQCMNNIKDSEDIINEYIFDFYNEAIIRGLSSSCDVIVIKSIYLINQLIPISFMDCLSFHKGVFKQINTYNWEILSLILIYCSKMLELYNRQKAEKENLEMQKEMQMLPVGNEEEGEENEMQSEQQDVQGVEEKSVHSKGSKGSKASSSKGRSGKDKDEHSNSRSQSHSQSQQQLMNEDSQQLQQQQQVQPHEGGYEEEEEHKGEDGDNDIVGVEVQDGGGNNIEIISQHSNNNNNNANQSGVDVNNINNNNNQVGPSQEDYTKNLEAILQQFELSEHLFLEIIDHIFSLPSPHMTIKIGFIYLAEILEFYPELGKKYMKLLIEYKDNNIRKEVLKVAQSHEEFEYTINGFTERYKFCGAPYFWNQLVIAGIFRDYVKENLDRFEKPHIMILHSIIINQNFKEEDSESWIVLYNDLKRYLFVALCEKEYSDISINICNKIFSFEKILGELLESTFDLFITTMKHIYSDEMEEEPRRNMKELLTFISEIKSEKNDCKKYVYKLMKTFAIQNDKLYIKSNLLDLMNTIYNDKRGKIFSD